MEIKDISETIFEDDDLSKKRIVNGDTVQGKGILMIPDLSGFTEFVMNSDLEKGRYITKRLLESIIQSNFLGFLVSEIEGDAVLFYKFDDLPELLDLKNQIEMFHRNFKDKLEKLSHEMNVKIPLSLKIIVHYGTFSTYRMGRFNKLYGAPVVEAHRMLKSRITDAPPYALFSKAFAAEYAGVSVSDVIRYSGEVKYRYVPDIGFVIYL